jgi:Fe-S-cluster-containing dehydrogenase component/CRP-like cAMP-binding protein
MATNSAAWTPRGYDRLMQSPTAISRLKATDVRFGQLTEDQLDLLVELDVFSMLDPEFRRSPAFRKILAKDARLVVFRDGEIIIREGDWGNTAYFVFSGTARVELEPPGTLSPESLGRRTLKKKGLFNAVAQLWRNRLVPEYRNIAQYEAAKATTARGTGEDTRIYLQDMPVVLAKHRTAVLHTGMLFGELAALGRTARSATVFATGDVELLEIRWQGLRDVMRKDKGFRAKVDETFRQNALREFLAGSHLFDGIAERSTAMDEILAGAHLETVGEYDKVGTLREAVDEGTRQNLSGEPLIAHEGDHPNGIVMVRTGLARVSHKYHHGHRTVGYLSPGQVYGFEEIEEGFRSGKPVPLQRSLRAIGFMCYVLIPTPLVEKHLLSQSPEKSPPRKKQKKSPPPPRPKLEAHRISQAFVEFLVQERFVNGTETMLIDLDRCTRCDDCVRACAAAHDNNPRFVRQGPISDRIMVANACMHCQDPVCMIECPTGAISRHADEGVVVINDLTCIGCGACAKNCPYDAIRMVEIRHQDGSFILDENTRMPIPKATKCDLCVDQMGGPACQRACPHDALIRMDMRDVELLSDWRNR